MAYHTTPKLSVITGRHAALRYILAKRQSARRHLEFEGSRRLQLNTGRILRIYIVLLKAGNRAHEADHDVCAALVDADFGGRCMDSGPTDSAKRAISTGNTDGIIEQLNRSKGRRRAGGGLPGHATEQHEGVVHEASAGSSSTRGFLAVGAPGPAASISASRSAGPSSVMGGSLAGSFGRGSGGVRRGVPANAGAARRPKDRAA